MTQHFSIMPVKLILPSQMGGIYLADARFTSSETLLVPYCNVQYHLSEWNCAKDP
jgi:hypothetical protein